MPLLETDDSAARATPPVFAMPSFGSSEGSEFSPVPEACGSNVSPGSASDHMGSLPLGPSYGATGTFVPSAAPSWQSVATKESSSSSVPRVVSTLMPTSSDSISSGGTKTSEADLDGKPVAARRRQTNKVRVESDPTVHRRQKRLERNRESARLSRRRRKQYLEVLEDRVTEHSEEMDRGRRAHVAEAVLTIQDKRKKLLNTSHLEDAAKKAQTLQHELARTSNEMAVTSTFRSQQLKSFCLPPSTKFVMWLTLETDNFFRGGRAASERLSAARIGERMLNSGTDAVTPSQSMWPLLCNEVGLSYEQEEKVRNFQRQTLLTVETWVDRHTGHASANAMENLHGATQALTMRLGQRERSALAILSDEQRLKFLAWAEQNRERLKRTTSNMAFKEEDEPLQTSPTQHLAANLYVLNHRLKSIMDKIPRAPSLVNGKALKKFARRPSFESLGCAEKQGLSRENSFASSGSLKRSISEMSMDGSGEERPVVPAISPHEAQASAMPAVEKELGHLKGIIPPPPTPTTFGPAFANLPAPTPVSSMTAPPVSASFSSTLMTHPGAAIAGKQFETSEPSHRRRSSFLPANVVPEEFFPGETAEDFLMNLTDEDWAIGEGIDMELEMP